MSAGPVSLAALQTWMMGAVTHPAPLEQARGGADLRPPGAAAPVILPSLRLTAEERLGLYREMYLLRMVDVLESDYHALAHFLGRRRFVELVRDYVGAHPSRSFSLNGLGRRLPDFVRARQGLPRRAFCHDLARLELAVSEVFDAVETPRLSAAAVAAIPVEAWERAVLEPIEAFRLMRFAYPVNAYLQTVRDDDHDHPPARRTRTWLAVYRRDFSVYRLDLSRPAYALLADLASGRPLGDALAAAAGRRSPRRVELGALSDWFRDWVAAGMFRAVRVD